MIKVWDRNACLKRMRDNEAFLSQLIKMFIDDIPEHMKNLTQAVNDNNFSQIHFYAHMMKGIAGNLSALQLHQQVNLLELAAKAENKKEIKNLHKLVIASEEIIVNEFHRYLQAC